MAKPKKQIKIQSPVPETPELWMPDIAMAFQGAQEFIKSGLAQRQEGNTEVYPWNLAPLLCMATRGADMDHKLLDQAATMAFSNFLQSYGEEEAVKLPPVLAFAYCYLGAHLGLELVDEDTAEAAFCMAEENLEALEELVHEAGKIIEKNNPFGIGGV